jgi:hypothetical protein
VRQTLKIWGVTTYLSQNILKAAGKSKLGLETSKRYIKSVMLVFSKQNLVFLAVPKTGTTAIEMALRPKADIVFAKHR